MKDGIKKTFAELALKYIQIPAIIAAFLCVAGLYSLFTMPRQEFPEFKIRQGIVVGVFPGASSELVDQQLARPLQRYLFQYKEIDKRKTYSISKENLCVVFVELHEEVKETDQTWARLRLGLKEFKAVLPNQVVMLLGNNEFGEASAVLFGVSSSKRSYRELETQMDKFEDLIRQYPAVANVKQFGLKREQITIYADSKRLSYYGINPSIIAAALNLESAVGYGGHVIDGKMEIPIHLPQQFRNEADVANQIVYTSPKGDIVRIKDIAEVRREYDTESSYVQVNGKNALVLSIEMLNGNNIVEFGKKTDEIVRKLKETMPEDIDIVKIADMPSVVKDSVGHFFQDFAMAIISVILVIMIFLPKRAAAVAALTIPISLLMSMALLEICGVQLNTVSLAALVMVLGMIVDNSIVVIDNHIEKLDEGIPLWQAAWSSASELAVPVFTATLAIVCTFATMPIFMNGIYKEFCMPVPITVAITLFISLVVAVLIVPGLQYSFIKKGVKREEADKKKGNSMLETLQGAYDRWLERTMKKPGKAIFISVICIIAGMAILATLPRQLFPKLERNQFAVEIYFAEGTSLQENEEKTKEMAEILRQDKRVRNAVSFIGTSSPRFHSLYAPQIPANNYSQLIVNTDSYRSAKEILKEYGPKYKDLYPNAHIKWKELDFLPVEAPIEVRISGNDIPSVKDFAAKVSAIMREEKNLAWVRDNYRNPLLAAELDIDREAADRLGITSSILALSVALNRNGMPLATIFDGEYARPVILKYADTKDAGAEALPDQHIYAPLASSPVMLRQVAKTRPSYSSGQVIRRNGRYTITVMADMEFGNLAEPAFRRISKKVNALPRPAGIDIEYGGEQEKTIETYIPFTKSLIASILLIFIILLFQFRKVRPALIVMATMPLSLVGGAAGLAILGYPFGMTSFIGFIGLFGIVVRNGVIMISYAQELQAKGMSLKEASIAAGKRRMRPIFLTASAAAVGVIPLITSGSSLWGPLGTVICFGLVSATVLTLYVLPAAYWRFAE